VRNGQGLNLAVPVDGVPVGLGLLNSDAADGSVSIKQARTIGLDTSTLWYQIQKWASDNKDYLTNYAQANGQTNFVRVVSRVYAVGEMTVNLRDARSQSAGLDVGAAKPVNLLAPDFSNGTNDSETVVRNYTNGWNTLQSLISQATAAVGSNNFLPGGSLRLAGASSRTVTLQEQFDPPVVFGYVGFDCIINSNGALGSPLPTFAVLDKSSRVHHGNSKPEVIDYNEQIKKQVDAFHDIKDAYARHDATQQQKDREYAKNLGLLNDSDGTNWVNRVGEKADGTRRTRTQKLENLAKMMNPQPK
jgi:hypothetical protein